MVYPITKRIFYPLTRLWTKKINGIENIPNQGGYLVAANHASYVDHLMLSSILAVYVDKKIHYLAKKEHFDTFFQRTWHTHTGAIPIDRQAGGKEALKEAIKCLRKGKVIGIYPEGTRTLTGKIQRAKTGIARLALAAKVHVLPIGIIGTFDILPKGKRIPRFRRATINIGKLMHFDKYYGKENNKKVIRLVTTKIMKEIARLSKQKYEFD